VLTVGVIGCGYWGPNLIRNFINQKQSRVKWVSDLSEDRLEHVGSLYPFLQKTKNYQDILDDPEVDAVVVATPVSTHFKLASEALNAGKHVFVEKPLAAKTEESLALVKLAEEKGLVGMVGHTFIYSPAVLKLKELVDSGELGDILYLRSRRLNLGLFQEDINVVWDLAPHDLSIFNFLMECEPEAVTAVGQGFVRPDIEDVAFMTLFYPGKRLAHVQVSWLDPNKVRELTVVGSKKMVVYDDNSNLEKIRIYDKGVDVHPHYDTYGEFQLAYRFGDINIPKLQDGEPLKTETGHFIECILDGVKCRSSFTHGHSVVSTLELACEAIQANGKQSH
jgi:predicted dehydrogenase